MIDHFSTQLQQARFTSFTICISCTFIDFPLLIFIIGWFYFNFASKITDIIHFHLKRLSYYPGNFDAFVQAREDKLTKQKRIHDSIGDIPILFFGVNDCVCLWFQLDLFESLMNTNALFIERKRTHIEQSMERMRKAAASNVKDQKRQSLVSITLICHHPPPFLPFFILFDLNKSMFIDCL